MRVVQGFQTLPAPLQKSAVTLGNFDGVHLGHRALFDQTIAAAKALGAPSVVYTFEPHPVQVLAPALAPPRLSPEKEKLRLIAASGIDVCVIEPFTKAFAAIPPSDFVTRVLQQALGAKEVIVGYDFTYGKGGAGNVTTLAEGPFEVHVVKPQSFGGVVASSTKIREFLHEGKVEGAHLLLGRDYAIEGRVVHGEARGRTIGFPTANIELGEALAPRYGVYACWCVVAGVRQAAVTNIGLRPTVSKESSAPTVEAHLLDWQGDLYEQTVRLEFVAHLRAEQRFASLDALKAQIARDAEQARTVLAS